MLLAALALTWHPAQDPLLVELRTERREYFAQESIPVNVRIGVAQDFLDRSLLPPFHRQLDLPFLLEGAWLPAAPPEAVEGFRFALNGVEAWARADGAEIRAGRAWSFYSYVAVLRAEAPGELALPAVALRYAVGKEFRDDPIHGRIAGGREDRQIASAPLRLTIKELPVAGRPASFRGAVGQFQIEAAAAPLELAPGEILTLRLRIRGGAAPSIFEAPDLSRLEGFELRGQLDDRGSPVRTVQYELLLRDASLPGIPALEFAYFDPVPPAVYRVARTAPIPLQVRGASAAPLTRTESAAPTLSLQAVQANAPPAPKLEPVGFALALWLPAGLTAGLGLLLRRRASDREDPLGLRARRAAVEFQHALRRHPERCAAAFAEYLAARLRLPSSAAIAPTLAQRLQTAGLDQAAAQAAAQTLEALVAAGYGGPPCADGTARARTQVRHLEVFFRARRSA